MGARKGVLPPGMDGEDTKSKRCVIKTDKTDMNVICFSICGYIEGVKTDKQIKQIILEKEKKKKEVVEL